MSNSSEKIRVFIVDDHAMVRKGLSLFLAANNDLELVGDASSGMEAINRFEQVQPDVILMDLVMPTMDGPTTISQLRDQYPDVKIIALTSFGDEQMVKSALEAGAIGYLLKDVSADKLAQAIRDAYVGRPTLAPEATQALIQSSTRPPKPGEDLTERERQVLTLMVDGLTNPEIADRLSVSRSTIKTHVSNILSKLEVSSRIEAVTIALQHKLVT